MGDTYAVVGRTNLLVCGQINEMYIDALNNMLPNKSIILNM